MWAISARMPAFCEGAEHPYPGGVFGLVWRRARKCHTQPSMSLVLKILSWLVAAALRVGFLVVVLFALHLVIKFAFPYVSESLEVLRNRPLILAQIESLEAKIEQERLQEISLSQRLSRLAEEQRGRLRDQLKNLTQKAEELQKRDLNVDARLATLQKKEDDACDSYNPFSLLSCYQLRKTNAQIRTELYELKSSLRRQKNSLKQSAKEGRERLARLMKEVEGDLDHPLFVEIKEARDAEQELRTTRGTSAQLRQQLAEKKQQRAEADALAASPGGRLLFEWQSVSSSLLLIVALVVAAPYLQRTLAYFALMPLVTKLRPLQLVAAASNREDAVLVDQALRFDQALRTLKLQIFPGSELNVRADYARSLENTDDCQVSSRLLYRWSAPFISYAAGLSLLTRVFIPSRAAGPRGVSLSSPSDPDSILLRVVLSEHPGVVVHPRHLVGLEGELQIFTRWRLFNLHAWSNGQVRFILIRGSGAMILEGRGDLVAEELFRSRARIEQAHLTAFDAHLSVSARRTETFLPYLFGKTPLVDTQFEGSGPFFWQKSPDRNARPLMERTFDLFFGSIGKFFGF